VRAAWALGVLGLVGVNFACNAVLGIDGHLVKIDAGPTSVSTEKADTSASTDDRDGAEAVADAEVPPDIEPPSSADASGTPPDAAPRDTPISVEDVAPQVPVCLVAGKTYTDGAPNPANACQKCQTSTSTTTFTSVSDGTSCGGENVCGGGVCAPGCFVDGIIYGANGQSRTNPCQVCQPSKSTTAWNNAADGADCGNGQICAGGRCGTQCVIGGTAYPSSTVNPSNACEICQPGSNTTGWTVGCAWKAAAFSTCSAKCGAGTQTRSVVCAAANNQVIAEALCPGTKPAATQACSATAGCAWKAGSYGPCSETCGTGTQTRKVTCTGDNAPTVPEEFCSTPKPIASQACTATKACTWTPGDWGPCSVRCGDGAMTRSITCTDLKGATMPTSFCTAAPPAAMQTCSGPVCTVYVVGEPTAANGPCYQGKCVGPEPAFPPCPAGYKEVRSERACGNPNECGTNWALCNFSKTVKYGCTAAGFWMPIAVRQCDHE
jgi:hypothetical protein